MSENFYDDILDQNNPKEAFDRSMHMAAGRQPEEFAKVLDISKKIGVGPDAITQNNIVDFQQAANQAENEYDKLFESSPKTTRWLSNPDNSSVARDEVKKLSQVEQSVHEHSASENLYNTLASGAAGFNARLAQIPEAVYSLGALPINVAIKTFGLPYKQLSPGDLWQNEPAKFFEKEQQALSAQSDWLDMNFEQAISSGDTKKISKYIAAQVLANAPSQAFNIMAAYSGMALPGLITTGLSTAGQSIAESESRGVEPLTATLAGVMKGATESLFESLGTFGLFKKFEGKIFQSLGSESYTQVLKEAAQTIGYSFLGEANEEALTSFVQDFTDYATGNKPEQLDGILLRSVESGLVGGFSGAAMTGPSSILAGMNRRLNTVRAEGSKDHLLNIEQQYENLELGKRSGDKGLEFLGDSLKNSASENVYFNPEALTEYFEKKGEDVTKVMKGLGMIEKWNAAKESGSMVVIPTAVFVKNFVGTEHIKGLANDVKFDSEGYSVNEVKDQETEAKEEQKMRDELKAEQMLAQDEELKNQMNQVAEHNKAVIRNNISSQLQATGKYNKNQADTQALVYEKFFTALEAQTNVPVSELFDTYAPEIKNGTFEIPSVKDESFMDKIISAVYPNAKEKPIEVSDAQAEIDDRAIKVLEKEFAEGPKLQKDKRGNIIPQLSVLMQLKMDADIGSKEAGQRILKRDGKGYDVTGAMRAGASAPDYILNLKGRDTYEQLQGRINDIIYKVKNEKPLTKYQQKFLNAIYEDAFYQAMNEYTKATGDVKPLFEKALGQIQGSYRPDLRLIQIGKSATLSTFIHESGHYFFDVIDKIVKDGKAPPSLLADYEKIREYVGAEAGADLTVEQQEKFADAFVNYLAAGKAPSKALRKAFETFKNWLFAVFKGVRMQPELNPEIIKVFDRLLATENEIDAYQAELNPMDYTGEFADKERNKYEQLAVEMRQEAQDKMYELALERENKKTRKEYKARREEVKTQVTEIANGMNVFKAIDTIKNNEDVGRIDRADVEKLGTEFAEGFPPELMKRGGSSAEILANVSGYDNMYSMLKDIVEYKGRDEWIEKRTDEQMAELYPELQDKVALSDEAKQAVDNETKSKRQQMELEMMFNRAHSTAKKVTKKLIERAPRRQVIVSAAVHAVAAKQLQDIKPYIHRRAEIKYAREAAKAWAKGDFEAAFEAKKLESFNTELFNSSQAALREIEKSKRLMKKMKKPDAELVKTREINYINVARAVMAMYGISPKTKKTVADYVENIKNYDEDFYKAVSILVEPIQAAAKPVEQTTFQEYLQMTDLIHSLWDMAGETKKIEVGEEQMSVDAVGEILIPDLVVLTPEKNNKVLSSKEAEELKEEGRNKNKKALLRRMESWTTGITTKGQAANLSSAHKYLFQQASSADTKYRTKVEEVNTKIKDEVKKLESWLKEEKDFLFKDDKVSLSKSQMFMVVLNLGNESNKRKLVVGNNWGTIEEGKFDSQNFDAEIQRAISEGYLTKQVFDSAQAIGNILAEMLPDTQKAHKKVKGFYFNKVANTPFKNQFGSYEGWYFPAAVDRAKIQNEKLMERVESDDSYQFVSKNMESGFAKDRNENYYGPLDLDFALVGRHVDKVVKFTYLEPARKDLFKLIKDEKISEAINNFDPAAMPSIILPFLERLKTQKIVAMNKEQKETQRIASFLKARVTIQVMTGLVSSGLQQFSGVLVTKSQFSGDNGSHITDAMRDYTIGGKRQKMLDFACNKSDWFRTELTNNNFALTKEIEDTVINKTDFKKAQEFFAKNAYFLQKYTQNIVNTVVWHAGYNRYMTENANATEADAVKYADSVVRTSQGTNNPIDVSQDQVADSYYQLAKQFTGYFNMVYNNNIAEFEKIEREIKTGGRKNEPAEIRIRKAVVYSLAVLAPAMATQIVLQMMNGKWFDNDGDGETSFLEILSSFGLSFLTSGIASSGANFIWKNAAVAGVNGFTKTPVDDRITNPTTVALEKAVSLAKDLSSGNKRSMIYDGAWAAGLITGLPIVPLSKPVKYLADVAGGKADPKNALDFGRGLVTGQPGGK